MPQLKRMLSGVWALLHKKAEDVELDEELQAYLQHSVDARTARGVDHAAAVRAAKVEMGSAAALKEEVRDVGWESALHGLIQDVRYGIRMLRKAPAVTLVCILTLGVAIGINATIFSIVNWLVLRPLPVRDPQQLTFLAFPRDAHKFDEFFSWTEFQELRSAGTRVFSDTAALMFSGVTGGSVRDGLTVDGRTEKIAPVYVTGSFFSMLGLQPHLGRLLLPSEGEARGANPVIVLSYGYWKARFGGDPAIIGKRALLDGQPVTIVGVAPRGFAGVTPIVEMQAYVPLGIAAEIGQTGRDFYAKPDGRGAILLARLRPGVTQSQAQSSLRAVGEKLQQEFPRPHTRHGLMVRPLRPPGLINGPNPLPGVAALFLTLAGLVLAVAAVNITSLLLARAAARRPEIAMRVALGATRFRLMRQLFTESVLLALLGCAVGIAVGWMGAAVLRSIPWQTEEALNFDFHFDWRVFAYVSVISLLTGLAVSVAPALRSLRVDLNQVLHDNQRGATAARQRLRSMLVVMQVSGALALIVTAGLFVRSLLAAEHANLGFDPAHVLNVSFDPHEIGYDQARAAGFYDSVLQRVQALPGVRTASFAAAVPLGEIPFQTEVSIPGQKSDPNQPVPLASFNMVTPEYLDTMGMTLLRGRYLSRSDVAGATDVAVITPTMAQRYWPGQDPLGHVFTTANEPQRPLRVVGMVNDSRYSQAYDPFDPLYFVPLAQHFTLARTLQVRTVGDPAAAARNILQTIATVDPTMPVFGVMTMRAALHSFNGLLMFEIAAGFAAVLGGVGLLLSIVGVYGVLSFSVTQRTREFGIRQALGATPLAVVGMIVRQGVVLVAAGLVIGAALALLVGRLVNNFLVGVTAGDPLTYAVVALLLTTSALIAVLLPAVRATRIHPATALRLE